VCLFINLAFLEKRQEASLLYKLLQALKHFAMQIAFLAQAAKKGCLRLKPSEHPSSLLGKG